MANKTIIAFDLYGTLLSTASIAKELASHFGEEKAKSIAAQWRRYQLEYTFRLNSMNVYKPFSDVTHASLHHALREQKLSLSDEDTKSLMKAYDSLSTFPEIDTALMSIRDDPSIEAYVFSNGTDAMVASSVKQSPSLSPLSSIFTDLITVEEVKKFKPEPVVYEHLAKKVGKSTSKKDMEEIWLVSGNPFDVVGARAVGMNAAWIDRDGVGWVDQLGTLAQGGPTVIAKGVDEAVQKIKDFAGEN